MGDKVLARAFELAKLAIEAEKDDTKATKAKELFTASIDAFKAVLSIPGFIHDDATRALIQAEVEGLKQRKNDLISRTDQQRQLEQRLEKLKDPNELGHLQARVERLRNGNHPKPSVTVEELAERLNKLNEDSPVPSTTKASAEIKKGSAEAQPTSSVASKTDSVSLGKQGSSLPADNPFAGDDWKRGLDPDLLDIIQKARDEASLM